MPHSQTGIFGKKTVILSVFTHFSYRYTPEIQPLSGLLEKHNINSFYNIQYQHIAITHSAKYSINAANLYTILLLNFSLHKTAHLPVS